MLVVVSTKHYSRVVLEYPPPSHIPYLIKIVLQTGNEFLTIFDDAMRIKMLH